MGKNVAVFVDVANIFYAAKAAGTDIDYVTLLKATTAGRDFVRAYAYTGLDPDNENQRNFHAFLARNSYKVVSKDIRKYGDGKVKANLDIELVVDMMKTARNLDIAIVISGDGDFAPAIRAVQEMGVRVEVVSFRGNTSSDLIEVADLFTDITQLARVDKTSSRSGRRVAGDDEDLSMTEVPDKLTEGTGQRGRGRGRGRGRAGEAEPVAVRGRTSSGRTSSREPAPVAEFAAPAAAGPGSGPMTVLPGEKLSRVASAGPPTVPAADFEAVDDPEMTPFEGVLPGVGPVDGDDGSPASEPRADADVEGETDSDGRRRRRRRGGRGRGRGRGRDGEGATPDEMTPAAPAASASFDDDEDEDADEADELLAAPVSRGPRTTPFGSVWDSQIGTPTSAPAGVGPVDDEDFEEPEIPEYLIAEQRRGRTQPGGRGIGQGNRGGGARGGRAAYTSAIDRERYGRGGGGGINRYPDVSGRERQGQGGQGGGRSAGGAPRRDGSDATNYARQDASYSRGGPTERVDRPAPASRDPWSEVPPELEELLRAQLAQSPKGRRPDAAGSRIEVADAAGEIETMIETTETKEAPETPATTEAPEAPARTASPARRRTPSRRKAGDAAEAPSGSIDSGPAAEAAPSDDAAPAPKRRATRRKVEPASTMDAPSSPTAPAPAAAGDAPAEAAPKRRMTRKKADADAASAEAPSATAAEAPSADATTAPKRRTTRKKAEPA